MKDCALDKVVYAGNRRYLLEDDVRRNDAENFYDEAVEHSDSPSLRIQEEINMFHVAYHRASSKADSDRIAKATGSKSPYSIMLLPG